MAIIPKKILYISGSHWDREWYLPFQSFRFRLVRMLNRVIETLEADSAFSVFMLDGQTIPLEDYQQMEPDKAVRLAALMKEGRVVAGPWYTMPDENLVSGESLVRNLLIGRRLAVQNGSEPMKCGYVCDMFGHTAQLPQILKGFGISSALLGRGTNAFDCPAHFLWEAPDGSRVAAFKVPEECGYGSFWLDVWQPWLSGDDLNEEHIVERACRYVDEELQRSDVPIVFLMDSMDHEAIHTRAPWLCSRLREHYGCPVELATPDTAIDDILAQADRLPVKRGELQNTARDMREHNKLIPHVLSSRYDIKLANDKNQSLLEKWVSPLLALHVLQDANTLRSAYDLAYRYLLQNHSHDSICGCSIDEVSQDMHYRFRQSSLIAGEIIDSLLYPGIRPTQPTDDGSFEISLYNPLAYAVNDIYTLSIPFPTDYKWQYDEQIPSEKINAFFLLDEQGAQLPYSILSIRRSTNVRRPCANYSVTADVYEVAVSLSLPPMGAVTLRVCPSDHPVRYLGSLLTSPLSAENEYVALTVHRNGTISLLDKATGHRYDQLLDYEDDGEAGDGWFHYAPPCDHTVAGGTVMVERLHDGPLRCVFRIVRILDVPAQMVYDRQYTARSENRVPFTITTTVTLNKGNRYVDLDIAVCNTARDHRLKLLLPTGVSGATYTAEQAFAFIERPIGIDFTTGHWKEAEKLEKPFSGIVYRRDATRGLAFLSAGGLHEAAALPDRDGTLAVTLFRSFSKTFLTDGQPDGQLSGQLMFKGRLFLMEATTTEADLVRSRDALVTGARLIEGSLTYPDGFCVEGENIGLSILKPAENGGGLILRLINYSKQSAEAVVHCPSAIRQAFVSDMLEEAESPVPVNDHRIRCVLAPSKIYTLLVTP